MKRPPFALVLAVICALALITLYEVTRPPVFNGSVINPPKPMPDFTLQSIDGQVRLSDFQNKYIILYFGYTSCPDLCPTTLAGFRKVMTILPGKQADQIQVIFVSVDYKRDTAEKVAQYVRNFSNSFIGLSGAHDQIDQVTSDYGISYKLNDPDPATGFYSVDHSASSFFLDKQHNLLATWPYGITPDRIASDIMLFMKEK